MGESMRWGSVLCGLGGRDRGGDGEGEEVKAVVFEWAGDAGR